MVLLIAAVSVSKVSLGTLLNSHDILGIHTLMLQLAHDNTFTKYPSNRNFKTLIPYARLPKVVI